MSTFGRYRLVRRIGAGGMAEIWKAKVEGPAGFEKVLAIKKILPEFADDKGFVDMFVDEAKLVAQLVHPNIVQVFDFGAVDNEYFIAMEYVGGTNLARLLKQLTQRDVRLSSEVAIYIGAEISKGLAYAHTKADSRGAALGIVHRDCTPHNILLSFGGEVKVSDFGIAKVSSAKSRTQGGMVRGKLAYMAPEQAAGEALDARTDLFALGVTIYELVTGQRLFSGEDDMKVFASVAEFTGLAPEQLAIVPRELQQILVKMLQPDPADRYPHARAVEIALASLLSSDAAITARETLSKLMISIFQKDYAMETDSSPVALPQPSFVRSVVAETGSRESDGGGGASIIGETLMSAQTAAEGSLPTVATPRSVVRERLVKGANAEPGFVDPFATAEGKARIGLFSAGLVAFLALAGGFTFGIVQHFRSQAIDTPVAIVPVSPEEITASPTPSESAVTATSISTATPIATPTRVVVRSTPVVTPRPTARPTAVAVKSTARSAFLFVTAQPWVEVWVDGERVARETPLRNFELPSGKHLLRFVNPPSKKEVAKTMELPNGGNLSLFVDVNAKTIDLN